LVKKGVDPNWGKEKRKAGIQDTNKINGRGGVKGYTGVKALGVPCEE